MVRARTSIRVYGLKYVVDGRQRTILRMIAALDIYLSDNCTDQAEVKG